MTPDQIVAFVLALTGPVPVDPLMPVIAAGGADPRYPVVAAPCPGPLAPYEIEGRTVVCGKVNVPEDHTKPSGRRIDLTFMIFKSRSLAPAPDAVVHLHGGPGNGIVENAGLTSVYFEQLRTRRDVVAFDQRGVDTSAGPDSRCFATLSSDPEALVQATKGAGDVLALTRKLTRDCLDEIKAGGADISTINTWQNAQDVSAVMHALGYPVYNIYGISYGTKLGQEVMRSAPDGLRSVVLDSTAPVQMPIYDTIALPLAEAIQYVFDYCTADAKCSAAYPDLQNRFWTLFSKLEAEPLKTPQGEISGQSLTGLLEKRNNWKAQLQGLTGYIPKIVADLEQGNAGTFLDARDGRIVLHPTPESALTGLNGLDANAQAFAEAALRLAQVGQINETAVAAALTRLEIERDAIANGQGLVDQFEAALLAAARELPDQPARVTFAASYLGLRTGAQTGAALDALLARHFSGETLTQLRALSRMMDADQIAEVFGRVGADNKALDLVLVAGFQTDMFACQEDMDINSPEGTAKLSLRIQTEFGWPADFTKTYEDYMSDNFFAVCEEFEQHPRPGFHDPVTAPIPTLVLQGSLDTQTAPSWGALMVSSLPKGQFAFFPESGHGSLAFSQCARDLGVAFLENPEVKVDSACTQALLPSFVLPDASMSK